MTAKLNSIIIPVYKNEGSLPELVSQLEQLQQRHKIALEVVFVVDGSPDRSFSILEQRLPQAGFQSQLLLLSRNFGSFSAIRAGLEAAEGDFFAIMAADLQEPAELPFQFFKELSAGDTDLVFGERNHRADPMTTVLASKLFWYLYRKVVQKDMPPGGVDIFGCNCEVRDQILSLQESNTTLVGLLLWIGYRRKFIPYDRRERVHGKSSWSFRRKVRYLLDSCFAFSDLPIRVLTLVGGTGIFLSLFLGVFILIAKITGVIQVPGYTALATLILFFGGLNSLGLGILGEYLWRTFENTKKRPNYIVFKKHEFMK